MTTRRWLIALIAVITLVTGIACKDTSSKSDPFPAPVDRPKAHPTAWDNTPATGDVPAEVQGPPVVNGDAGPQNDSHFVVYQLVFVSKREAGGHVEYIDQNGHTVENVTVKVHHKNVAGDRGGWAGQWEHVERAHLGIAMGFTWYPIASADTWAMCGMIYNGTPVDYQIVQYGPCAVSFTLPNQLPKPRNP
jgi:hypothetical protein